MKMPSAVATDAPRQFPMWFWPWLVVLAVVLFTGFIRLRLLEMPLERDEGEYAYAGQLLLQGIPPYELAYNMKLPGTYFGYAAGMAIFGQTATGVHLTLLAVNSLTCVFVFLLGRKLFGVTAGLVACASYAFLSASPAVYGLAAHATQFVVLFAIPGVMLLWNALSAGERRVFFLSGLLFGLAGMMKQPGFCFAFFAVAMMIYQALQDRSLVSRVFGLRLLSFSVGVVLPFAFLCLGVALAGDFKRFWFWTYDYAAHYAAGSSWHQGCHLLAAYIHANFLVYAGYLLLATAGVLAAVQAKRKQNELTFVLALLCCSVLGTMPGLYFREHYFVLLLPALAVVVGASIELLQTDCFPKRARFVAPVLVIIVLAGNVYLQRRVFFQLTPPQVVEEIYMGNPFVESLPIAQFIREHSKPDAQVAVIGSEPELYFYANRHSATGYIYLYPLMEAQPWSSSMQREMTNEIEAAKPEFMVLVLYNLSWLSRETFDPTIFLWAQQYSHEFYQPVAAIGRNSKGQIVAASGKAADNFPNLVQASMVLYQRKSDVN